VSVIASHNDCTARRMRSLCVLPEWSARGQASRVSNHGKWRGDWSLLQNVHCFWGPTRVIFKTFQGLFLEPSSGRRVKLITHLHLLLRLTGLNYISTPPICLHGVHDEQPRVLSHPPTWLQGLRHRLSLSVLYECRNAPPAHYSVVNLSLIKWHYERDF